METSIKNNMLQFVVNNNLVEYDLNDVDSLVLKYNGRTNMIVVDKVVSTTKEFIVNKPNPVNVIRPYITYWDLLGNGWTPRQVMDSVEWSFLLPKDVEAKLEAEGSTPVTPEPPKAPKAPEKVGKRGRINEVNRKREFAGRRPHNKDQGTMKRQNICTVADAYILYVEGGAAETLIKSLNDVKLSTFYSWCSTITRLLASKNVPGKLIKLRQIARIVADKQR